MITPARVIPYLLILIMGLFIAYQCKSSKIQQLERFQENSRFQEQIQKHRDTAAMAAARFNELQAERSKLRDSVKVAVKASIEEIQGYKKVIAHLRPLVASKIDSFPDLRDFVAAQDSTIAQQDTLITSLQLAHSAEIINLESQLRERGRQLMQKDAINELLQSRNQELEKQVKKGQRTVRVWKVVSTVLAGGIVYMAIKE